MAVAGGEGFNSMIAGGKAGQDGSGKLYIADNGLDPSEVGFETEPYIHVLTQGLASTTATTPLVIDASHSVEWGVWQATAAAPAELHTDASDNAVFTAIEQPVYWGTVTASLPEAINARAGLVSYSNVLGFIGGGSSGEISELFMSLNVNFDTAAADGSVTISTPAEIWNLDLSGAITGPVLDFSTVTGDVNGNAVEGEFNGLFTGDTAQAIVSSFDFGAIDNPTLHVAGLAVVDDADVGDLRLTGVSLNQLGMYQLIDFDVAGFDSHIGQTGLDGSGNRYFAENGFMPDQPEFQTSPFTTVLSQGAAPELNLYTDATYPVSWGIWDGTAAQAATLATDANNPLITTDIVQPIHWLTVEPVEPPTTGSMTYQHVVAFDGVGSAGAAITDVFMSLDINFDTASVSGNAQIYTSASEVWDANLSGGLLASGLDINNVTGLYNSVSAINGQVGAIFTGTNAEALAGMLSFEVTGTPSLYVDSMFLVDNAAVADVRLEGVTLDRLGLLFESGVGVDVNQSFLGQSSDGSTGAPVITDNELDPGQAGYNTTAPLNVFSQTDLGLTTTATTMSLQTFAIDGSHSVSWGVWQGAAESPVYSYESATDPNIFTTIQNPVYWSTLDLPSAGLPGAGFARYNNVLGFVGEGQGGSAITNVYVDLGVDFTAAQASGKIHIYNSDAWYLDVTGNFSTTEPLLYLNVTGGEFNNVAGVSGYVDAAFTGTTGNALLGMFDVEQSSNANNFVEGMFVVDDTPVQDVRLTAAEQTSIDRVGMVIKSNVLAGSDVIFGGATPGTDPIFAFNGFVPVDASYSTTPFFEVVKRNGITEHSAPATHGTYPVTWGIWDAGSLWQLSHFDPDPSQAMVVNDPLVWMTVLPTSNAAMVSVSGGARYASTGETFGLYDGGILSFHNNYLDVNFDTATFAGHLYVAALASTIEWDVFYTGNIMGSHLDITAYGNTYFNNSPAAIDSNIEMSFTGASAEAVAGAFDLELVSDPATFSQGAFVAERDARLTHTEAASLDRVGLISSDSFGSQVGLSSSGAGGLPVIGLNGQSLSDERFKTDAFSDVLKVGGAVPTNLTIQVVGSPNFEVNWGAWDGTGTAYETYVDPASGGVFSVRTDVLRWMTVKPTVNVPTIGTVTYDTSLVFDAGGNNGAAALDGFTATVDFGAGNLTAGALNFTDGGGVWNSSFTGSLGQGGEIIVPTASISGMGAGNSIVAAGTGMNLVLTGSTAQAVAGSFKFTNTVSDHVSGVFLICQNGGGC